MTDPLKPPLADDEQASLWAARLDAGQLSAADRAELDAWLAQSSGRAPLLARYTDLSTDLGLCLPELAAAGLLERPAVPARRPRRRAWALAGVGGCAAAVLVAVVWVRRPALQAEDLVAPAGEPRSFTLSDGSRVELNANTALVIETSRSERRVRLENGEAFFEVSKDPSRPFIVETPAGSVRVTGTKFSVLTETATQLDVTVMEGSVRVSAGAAETTLHRGGEAATLPGGGLGLKALSDEALEDALAWRRGQIVCDGSPLDTVLARFAHYHGQVITATPAAAAKLVGGIHPLGDLDAFLTFVRSELKLEVRRSADGSIRVSKPGEP